MYITLLLLLMSCTAEEAFLIIIINWFMTKKEMVKFKMMGPGLESCLIPPIESISRDVSTVRTHNYI